LVLCLELFKAKLKISKKINMGEYSDEGLDRFELMDFDEEETGGGGGGGGGKKKKHQGDETRLALSADMRKGQLQNAAERSDNDEKSPVDEVQDVLDYINKMDESNVEMKNFTRYLDWLKANINAIDDLVVKESDMSSWEQMTASVHAGGGGRQTSRNARARTHLITGIRASAEKDRKATPNEHIVMEKIEMKLKRHLQNWKVLMMPTYAPEERMTLQKPVDLERLEGFVLDKVSNQEV